MLWWNVLVASLATNFQDLVAKVKNLVSMAPVLGAISRPERQMCVITLELTLLDFSNFEQLGLYVTWKFCRSLFWG